MSLHEYQISQLIDIQDRPFYALIMAAMRQADTLNLEKLQRAFPLTWAEFERRYHAPGGRLPEDGPSSGSETREGERKGDTQV